MRQKRLTRKDIIKQKQKRAEELLHVLSSYAHRYHMKRKFHDIDSEVIRNIGRKYDFYRKEYSEICVDVFGAPTRNDLPFLEQMKNIDKWRSKILNL